MKEPLKETFERAKKNIRMWPTWKLKCADAAGSLTLWDGMSEEDKAFNDLWCQVAARCRTMSAADLQKVLESLPQENS